MRISTITIISLTLMQFVGINQVVSQCQCLQQMTFKQFSESYTQTGLKDYWVELYSTYDIPQDFRKSHMTGMVRFAIKIDDTGGLTMYFENHLHSEVNNEFVAVITRSRRMLKKDATCLHITGSFAIEKLEKEHKYLDGFIPDLIFAYMDPISRH